LNQKTNAVSLHFFIANGSPIAMTTRYRCLHLSEQLRMLGHGTEIVDWWDETKVDPETPLNYDVIVLYRLMMSSAIERLIAAAQRLGKPVIYDTDDLIFEPDLIAAHRAVRSLSESDQKLYAEGVGRYLMTLQACDVVMTSTPVLADLARQRGKKAFVHRNSLGDEMLALANQLYEASSRRIGNSRVVIGYGSGTHTHDVDFVEATEALVHLLHQFPNAELWIAGPLNISQALENLGERVRRFPLTDWPGWFELASQLDIALAPLELDNIFCRAKSEIKFVEAGALRVPVVGSDVDPYRDSITQGEDGLLATSEKDWIDALSSLIESPERRREMGERARKTILQRYSPKARAADLARILPQLIATGKPSPVGRTIAE
jgi:O-antigen biosynthesis protein